MTDLDVSVASSAGLLVRQSLIHVPDDEVLPVLEGLHRALLPGGPLQLLFHVGDEAQLKTPRYGEHPMRAHVHRRRPHKVAAWLRDVGSAVEAQMLLHWDGEASQAIMFARRRDHG